MKQLLLHGPAIVSSRKKLSEIKKKFEQDNIIVFEQGTDTGQILTNLQSGSLFGGERLVILENCPEDFTPLTHTTNPLTLIFWFDHEIDTKKYPNTEILFFPEGKEISVFPFLDYLGNKSNNAFLELDKLKKVGFASQYIITMILYLLRNLVATPKGAKDFVKNKNARMRKNFSESELINTYQFVLNTDFKIKSGLIEEAQAEFLLVNLFLH